MTACLPTAFRRRQRMFFAEVNEAPLWMAAAVLLIDRIAANVILVMNARRHDDKLQQLRHDFNGTIEKQVAATLAQSESAKGVALGDASDRERAAFERGLKAAGTGVDGMAPVDPEILAKAYRLLVKEGNGPPHPLSEITEEKFGPKV